MTQVAVILLNYCCGAVAEEEIVKDNKLVGKEPLSLLRFLMPIAGPKIRIFILSTLETKLE